GGKRGKGAARLEAFEYAIALHELYNPEEAQRLHQGLQEMGLL
ncbi:MAG: glycosyltransferase, partial [Dolichospermum sp.]